MSNMGFFIDVERFVQWTYDNEEIFRSEELSDLGENTVKKWRRYEAFPNEGSLQIINSKLKKNVEPFEKINIAEMMICINNAKDHNRGKQVDLTAITSTGKKIMTLLLLGRILDRNKIDGFFVASKTRNIDVHTYLANFSKSKNSVKNFYYLPGRVVSFNQLCSLAKDYKNGITPRGIYGGLKFLQEIGLIKCVNDELYKLDFQGCKEFLDRNK